MVFDSFSFHFSSSFSTRRTPLVSSRILPSFIIVIQSSSSSNMKSLVFLGVMTTLLMALTMFFPSVSSRSPSPLGFFPSYDEIAEFSAATRRSPSCQSHPDMTICKASSPSPSSSSSPPFGRGLLFSPIPAPIQSRMINSTYHPICPVPLSSLVYLQIPFYQLASTPSAPPVVSIGEMVLHTLIADEVLDVFSTLFDTPFILHSMLLMDYFEGNDTAAGYANNTSAYNCRPNTSDPKKFSLHSYGLAIDINDYVNPYWNLQTGEVEPPTAKEYLNRNNPQFDNLPGFIHNDSVVVREFLKRGYQWGGMWIHVKDYQHFEKDLNITSSI